MKGLALIFIVTCLSSCSISNEGQTDYRYVKPSGSETQKYTTSSGSENKIRAGSPLVVSLKQVFIADATELSSPIDLVRGDQAKAEVAIVVNAFEKGTNSLDFSRGGLKNAKVVFFSDDVREGRFLNLSNISTVYGPLKYDGKSFILDIYMIEMDLPGDQLKQLLNNLANIGSTFYPPAAPTAGVLTTLSESLITDNQEDIIFHYTAELKPVGGTNSLHTGRLEAGHYVFLREESEEKRVNWSDMSLHLPTGRLIFDNSSCDKNDVNISSDCYYRENTYVVVEVDTASSSLSNDIQQMTYETLENKVYSSGSMLTLSSIDTSKMEVIEIKRNNLVNAEKISKEVRVLSSYGSDNIQKRLAFSKFQSYWFDHRNDGDLNYRLEKDDHDRIMGELVEIVTSCTEANDVKFALDILSTLRNREKGTHDDSDLLRALVCNAEESPGDIL